MLRSLTIRDFVIVERLDLEFGRGFTVLTGETGAGKSILIEALAAVLGERAESGLVREGCEKAEVAAEFTIERNAALRGYLEENDLAQDGLCLLRRVIDSGGRSRAYVNGRPATVQQLKDIGEYLVDIHGQHAHQSLLRPVQQRELLDRYAGATALAVEVADAWRAWQSAKQARQSAESDAAGAAREREQLEWQVGELSALNFRPEEWDELNQEHRRLAHAASLIEGAESALQALSEDEVSALASIAGAQSRLKALLQYDQTLKEVLEGVAGAQIQLQEAVYALRRYQQRLELDPRRLREVESRIEAIHAAARKYRTAPQDLPQMLQRASDRLRELDTRLNPDAAARREAQLKSTYLAAAGRLGAVRARAADELSDKVSEAMQRLAMKGGRFEIALTPLEEGAAYGTEEVEFLVAAHPGVAPRPLAKVASGGELSRISLAIQTVTSQVARVPTLVFDEVDVGIGGGVAEIVGRMLKALGRSHQVMCVTHLPQVAAAADHQWRVAKRAVPGGVASSVTVLDAPARVEEIARMLGGVKITETTRRHAEEMLGMKA
ncbi:MAG TPA: DNA repair protein RecN [Burkholderiales bacterium]|nr:DNA repair protein RecN [Burkholderiales bacterium]